MNINCRIQIAEGGYLVSSELHNPGKIWQNFFFEKSKEQKQPSYM